MNTPFSVLRADSRFWGCHEGVWYAGAAPKGPWTVSDERPPGVDAIPPSAPVYNVKYVYVYQSTPEVVYVGYTPGYVGVYPCYGSVVYGTGFHYPPYMSPYVYYPRPVTYGFHVSYNPWTGWGFGMSVSGPFMSFGVHFGGAYGPYRPPYHGGGWYGAGGYRPPPPPGYRPPHLLIRVLPFFRTRCVDGIVANKEVNQEHLERSVGIVTALNPVLGYEKTTELAAEAMKTNKGVLELVREKKLLTEEQIQKLMDVKALTGQQ